MTGVQVMLMPEKIYDNEKKYNRLHAKFFSKENTKNTHLIRIFNDIDQHFEL